MWPGKIPETTSTNVGWEDDLGLGELVQALSPDKIHQPFIRKTLTALNTDAQVIAWRQAVMTDFMKNPELAGEVESILPRLAHLRMGTALLGKRQRNLLLDTADRAAELDSYVHIVADLHEALAVSTLESKALLQLHSHLETLMADEHFQTLQRDLPDMRSPLENIRSLTIGINLDVELKPYSAALLAINDYPVGERAALLERLIGIRQDEHDESGLAPMHYTPRDADQRPLSPLFQDLDRLLTQTAQPIAKALNRYVRIGTVTLASLENEFAFYVGAVHLIARLQERGIAYCVPQATLIEERSIQINDLTNISLALKQAERPVPSQAEFDDNGRIAILTGPNSGGKTTYLRSVGLAQVMFQAGLFVAARNARLSPVDKITTHFPALESRQQGRLAEEAARLHKIFQQITPYSLVLLNETFSSTSSGEAFYLARDILCALCIVGVRAIYATHLTELAEHLSEIGQRVEGASRLFSLAASVQITDEGQTRPTFEIKRGLPLGQDYARQIAQHHGISLEQILDMRGQNGTKPS
jgi:hypothetical protein